MVEYSIASASEDGASNHVIMNGKAGYLGCSTVYLKYMEDGWIRLRGDNIEESSGWKLLSIFVLEPGTYTLKGMTGISQDTITLQLHISDDTGDSRYYTQYNEDVVFNLEREEKATLHVRVFPNVRNVDVMARPAVYRNE